MNVYCEHMFIILSFGVLNSKKAKTAVKMNQKQQVYCCETAANAAVI